MIAPATKHIAYLLTHYPSPSHTFIYGEISALERLGVEISPISVNVIGAADLLSDDDRIEAERTYYIKSLAKAAILCRVATFAARRPASLFRTIRLALKTAGWDFHALLWHLFHVVEAVLVLRRCEGVGATHLHSHFGGLPSTIAMYASELSICRGARRLPWSVTVHGFHEFANERSSLLREKVCEASFVACISDYTRAQLMRIVGDTAKWPDIHVVRCGIDLDRFRFEPRLRISEPVHIMITARVVAEKGFGVLFDAMVLLAQRNVETQLTVVGDGPARALLTARAVELGLADRIQWTGFQPPAAVLHWLGQADVFCLPSFAEGLPIVLMEAMAVGVPVVGTFLGGVPELVRDGHTGRLVPAGRADLLADALEHLSHSSPERESMVKSARQAVEEMHEMHRSARQLMELFQNGSTR